MKHPLYMTHALMKQRCSNPNHKSYSRYGGRGIKVCGQWTGKDGFTTFLADMGEKPSVKHTLDRIDNDGDYTPDNCRWATWSEQNLNKAKYLKGGLGVYWHRVRAKWYASISIDGKNKHLGAFVSKADALNARREAETAYV